MSDDIFILGINMTKFGKHPDLDTVGHAHAAASVGQPGVDPPPGHVEQHHRHGRLHRPGQVAVLRRLDQVEPHRAAPPPGVEVADDTPHPHLVGERDAQAGRHGLAQLGHGPRGIAGVVPQGGRRRGTV